MRLTKKRTMARTKRTKKGGYEWRKRVKKNKNLIIGVGKKRSRKNMNK